jgi:hypothetical protein
MLSEGARYIKGNAVFFLGLAVSVYGTPVAILSKRFL